MRHPAKLSELHKQVSDEQQHARYDSMRGTILHQVKKVLTRWLRSTASQLNKVLKAKKLDDKVVKLEAEIKAAAAILQTDRSDAGNQ